MQMESNYPIPTSSPIAEALPSPNLTEGSLSSPKNSSEQVVNGPSPMLTSILRSYNSSSNSVISNPSSCKKELNITEYSNKELKAMKKRCRTVMTPSQSRVLRKVLEQTAFPSTEIREGLAKMLGMKPRTVQIWFQNQRQKTRQGRSPSDDSISSETDAESGDPSDMMMMDESSDSMSPRDGSMNTNGDSFTPSPPSFNALTAAAFALSNTIPSLEGPSPSSSSNANEHLPQPHHYQQQQQQQYQQPRYSNFHGAVFKSTPGCIPMPTFRGNTATAMNNRRLSGAAAASMTSPGHNNSISHIQTSPNQFLMSHSNFLPNQPQMIPSYSSAIPPSGHRSSTPVAFEGIPLDVLAAAVSNFRPNGYNYNLPPPSQPIRPHQHQQQQQQQQVKVNITTTTSNSNVGFTDRNRLAPIRTPSPPLFTEQSSSGKLLPSLKALAQVASIGMEQLMENAGEDKTKNFNPRENLKFSSTETTNLVAPNDTCLSARRPW